MPAQLALAQVGIENERAFIDGPKATGHGHRAHHDRAGILAEGFIGFMGGLGVVHRADRMGVAVVGTGARHFVEGQFGAGGDDKIIVIDGLPVLYREPVVGGVDLGDRPTDETDVLLFEVGADREGDIVAPAPADQQPRVGREELELLAGVDHRDIVGLAQFFPGFVGEGNAADARAHHNDMSHDCFS